MNECLVIEGFGACGCPSTYVGDNWKTNVFSFACVIYCFLTRNHHPFHLDPAGCQFSYDSDKPDNQPTTKQTEEKVQENIKEKKFDLSGEKSFLKMVFFCFISFFFSFA